MLAIDTDILHLFKKTKKKKKTFCMMKYSPNIPLVESFSNGKANFIWEDNVILQHFAKVGGTLATFPRTNIT
jgi:hypothetical protein